MDKINFEDLPSETTPVRAANLNQMQNNIETALNNAIKEIKIDNIKLIQDFEFRDNGGGQVYYDLVGLYSTNLTKKEIGYTTSPSGTASPTYQTINYTSGGISTGIQNNFAYIWIRLTYSDLGVIVINTDKYGERYSVYLSGGGQACFEGDTKVLTPNGLTPIKDLKLNDAIITEDGIKTITKKYEHIVTTLFNIYVGKEIIKSSYSHPFVTQRGYVNAVDLKEGDMLEDKDGNILRVDKIEIEKVDIPVYEINTDNADNYYITESEILVGSEFLM